MRIVANVVLASNAFRERFENPISIKSLLMFGAIIALCVGLAIALGVAKNKKGEKGSQNLTPFFEDETLETKKLERTLAVALLAVAAIAIAMAAYYVWEPTRQAKMTTSFEERSVRRGQTLFANEATKGYSSTQSLSCANCHGGYNEETGRWAEGGTAQYTLKALKDESDPACAGDNKFTNADCVTVSVAWQAPALNTALYKYPIRKHEEDNPFKSSCRLSEQRSTADCRSQVYDILTYGRAGTPMPAWGVAGGGAKNEQAIDDLVNFLAAIQLPADESAQPLRSGEIIKQKKKISEAKEKLSTAKEEVLAKGVAPEDVESDASVIAAQEAVDVEKAALKAIESKTETQFIREAAITQANTDIDAAEKTLNEDAPTAVAKAQSDYDAAQNAYKAEDSLKLFGNPQDYLDSLEKDQTEIKIEKQIEDAKSKKDTKAAKKADVDLQEVLRLKNITQNFIESRDALATAKATLQIFAPEALTNSRTRLAQLEAESDGQLLFEANCARCHTKGWSYFTPSNGRVPLPAPQGTGALGPKLSGVDLIRQFVNPADQFSFISNGSAFQSPFGAQGIGTGRMPGFNTSVGRVLDDEQIDAIVNYERTDLNGSGRNAIGTRNLGTGTLTDTAEDEEDK